MMFPKPKDQKRTPKYLCDDGVFRYPDGREVCAIKTKKGMDEYQNRKFKMLDRQGGLCALQITDICRNRRGRWPKNEMQFDHESGRGGGKQDDRIEVERDGRMVFQNAAVCAYCNCEKGSRKIKYNHNLLEAI